MLLLYLNIIKGINIKIIKIFIGKLNLVNQKSNRIIWNNINKLKLILINKQLNEY